MPDIQTHHGSSLSEVIMATRSSDPKKTASGKGQTKFAERKRVLKKGSDRDIVREFGKKKA